MKAIIPVAGVGTRLRPQTHTQPKALVPVAGKPILAHIVDGLIEWGIDEFVFIIGYMGDKIESYVQENYPDITSFFVLQSDGKGTAHALWLARDTFEKDDRILIVLGDTIIKAPGSDFINSEHTVIGVKSVDDPRSFGVAEIDKDGIVTSLVEKPKIPMSNLALVGIYGINDVRSFSKGLKHVMEESTRPDGEYHITDVLMYMVDQGETIQTVRVESWFDCGKKDILLETNALLLKQNDLPEPDSAQVLNSILVQPVHLANGAKVENCIIGPNVSIGENCLIRYSIVKDTIIGSNSSILEVNLNHSVIGSGNTLHGSVLSLNLGDDTEINME